jgi:hypothetical protein
MKKIIILILAVPAVVTNPETENVGAGFPCTEKSPCF